MLPTIKLRIHNKRDFYVGEDTLRGDVQLMVSDECQIHSVRAEIGCTEHAKLPVYGAMTPSVHKCERDLLLDTGVVSGGCHSYAFSLSIPKNDDDYPPSLDVVEMPNCGVRWYVKATAEVDIGRERQTLVHSDLLRVFLAPSQRELQEIGVVTSIKHSFRGVKLWMSSPRYLPQAPNLINFSIWMTLAEPTLVRYVKVYIETVIVMWRGAESKAFLRSELLETVRVNAVVRELEMDGVSRRWQLKGLLAAPFKSRCFCLQYNQRVELKFNDDAPFSMTWLDTLVSSPALVLAAEKAESQYTAQYEEPPPPYS